MLHPAAKKAIHITILLALSFYLFFWRIGDLNLFGTEPYRALPAQTMLDTHEWLVPHLNGEPFLTKPPLTYWLIGLSSLPHGKVTETSARIPSAIAAVLLIVAIYWFISSTVSAEAGFLSALVALTTYLLFEKAIAAEIDMELAAFVCISEFLMFKGISASPDGKEISDAAGSSRALPYVLGAYVFLAAAFLTKGPPALAFFAATIIGFLLWERRSRFLLTGANVAGVVIFVILCTLWITLVIFKVGWNELSQNIQKEFIARVGNSTSLRAADVLFYPLGIVAGFAPWSFFLPFVFLPSYYRSMDERRRSLQRFLYCGVVLSVILFSSVAGKANRYLLPVYPLLAIMVGLFWYDFTRGDMPEKLHKALQLLLKVFLGVSAAGLATFVIVQAVSGFPSLPASTLSLAALAVVLAVGFFLAQKANYRGVFVSVIILFLLIKLIYAFDYVPYRNSRHSIRGIAAAVNGETERGRVIYTVSFDKPHIFFYLNNPVIKLKDLSLIRQAAVQGGYLLLTDEELQPLVNDISGRKKLCEFQYHKERLSLLSLDSTQQRSGSDERKAELTHEK